MAGNSSRQGAVRKQGTKKGAVVGSGGQRRRGLEAKGPTPKAEDRTGHPASRRKRATERRGKPPGKGGRGQGGSETITGRNAVHEALLAGVPAAELQVLDTIEADDRVRASVGIANKTGIPVRTVNRTALDAVGGGHQGMALVVEPFRYVELADLRGAAESGVLVALDHITDPHNVGAIARSAAAFGAAGLLLPQRRAAPVTAAAWKASAGTLATVPVARVSNLVTAIRGLQQQGFFAVGLTGDAATPIDGLASRLVEGPLVLVVGSEGSGLARLTAETCDVLARIPMPGGAESLNASVAAGIALYSVTRSR